MLPVKRSKTFHDHTNPVPFMDQDKGVVVNILGRQTVWSVGAFNLVCKDWYQLLQGPYFATRVWKAVAFSQFPYIDQERIPDFRSYLKLDSNLTRGVYSLTTLPDARRPIVVKGERLFSRSIKNEREVLIWDWRNQTCTGILCADEGKYVASMAISEDGKYLFSRDAKHDEIGTVKKWDLETGVCLATCQTPKEEPKGDVQALVLVAGDQVFTNSMDGSIKVWNAASLDLVYTIPCPLPLQEGPVVKQALVSSWVVDDKKEWLYAGYTDGRIRIWDLVTMSCIATREPDLGHPGKTSRMNNGSFGDDSVKPMLLKDGKLFFGYSISQCPSLRSWDVEQNISSTLLGQHGHWGRPMTIMEDTLFSGFNKLFNYLRICPMKDLEETKGVRSVLIKMHNGCMRELFGENRVLFLSADRSVEILDFTKSQGKILSEIAEQIAKENVFMAEGEDYGSEEEADTPAKRMKNKNQEILIRESMYGFPYREGLWYEGELWEGAHSRGEEASESEDSLESEDSDAPPPDVPDSGIERFSRLDPMTQEAIFKEFDTLLRHDNPKYNGCPEDAFYNQNGQSATSAQRAEAIFMYLERTLSNSN